MQTSKNTTRFIDTCDEKRQRLIEEHEASVACSMCHDDRESDSDPSQDAAKRIQEQEKPQSHEIDDGPEATNR